MSQGKRRTARGRIPTILLRWEFTRGRERVSCQIDRDPQTGEFAVVSWSDLRRASFETFQMLAAAFRRHARVAADLRGAGWKLSSYTDG